MHSTYKIEVSRSARMPMSAHARWARAAGLVVAIATVVATAVLVWSDSSRRSLADSASRDSEISGDLQSSTPFPPHSSGVIPVSVSKATRNPTPGKFVTIAQSSEAAPEARDATPRNLELPDPNAPKGMATLSPLHVAWFNKYPDDPNMRAWYARHEDLEQEPRDPAWGESIERDVGAYFATQPHTLGLELLSVSCRSTRCEIQAADAQATETGMQDGQLFMSQMARQVWWKTDIGNIETYVSQMDGRTIYWTYLTRKE